MEKVKLIIATESGLNEQDFSWEESDLKGDEIEIKNWEEASPYNIVTKSKSIGSITIPIATIGNWPEYKTEYKNKTIGKVFGKKIKTKVPVVYRRNCTKKIFALITYPAHLEVQFVRDVEECGKIAAAASVVAAIATGATGAAPAFMAAFEACIKYKLDDKASQLNIKIDSDKKCGEWVPY